MTTTQTVTQLGKIILDKGTMDLPMYCSEFAWHMLALSNCTEADILSAGPEGASCVKPVFAPMQLAATDAQSTGLAEGPLVSILAAPAAARAILVAQIFVAGNAGRLSSGHRAVAEQVAPLMSGLSQYYGARAQGATAEMTAGAAGQLNAGVQNVPNYSPTSFIVSAVQPAGLRRSTTSRPSCSWTATRISRRRSASRCRAGPRSRSEPMRRLAEAAAFALGIATGLVACSGESASDAPASTSPEAGSPGNDTDADASTTATDAQAVTPEPLPADPLTACPPLYRQSAPVSGLNKDFVVSGQSREFVLSSRPRPSPVRARSSSASTARARTAPSSRRAPSSPSSPRRASSSSSPRASATAASGRFGMACAPPETKPPPTRIPISSTPSSAAPLRTSPSTRSVSSSAATPQAASSRTRSFARARTSSQAGLLARGVFSLTSNGSDRPDGLDVRPRHVGR